MSLGHFSKIWLSFESYRTSHLNEQPKHIVLWPNPSVKIYCSQFWCLVGTLKRVGLTHQSFLVGSNNLFTEKVQAIQKNTIVWQELCGTKDIRMRYYIIQNQVDRTGFLAPWIRLVFLKIFCDDGFLILVGGLVPVSYFLPKLD